MELTTINQRYRVLRELARGGMGCVFLVEDVQQDGRRCALKTILPEASTSQFVDRFRTEFAGLAKLSHPNIASAYDFGRIAGTQEHFFTAEFIDGVDLFTGTADAAIDQLLSVTVQLLRGLAFIHSHRLLHNDLKPANILLERADANAGGSDGLSQLESSVYGQSRRVRIIDFGLLSAENTTWEKVVGTPQYMSPERIRRAPADRRSDLYSAGIVIHALCARSLPFSAPTTAALLKKHLSEAAPSLASLRSDLPRALIEVVDRLLRKDPKERFQRAEDALHHLGASLDAGPAVEARSTAQALASGSLIARRAELEALEGAFEKASTGSLECPGILLTGPPGVGKTRLVEALRGQVQVRGGAFVHVCGAQVEGHLIPVANAILRGLETCGAQGLEAFSSQLLPAGARSATPLAQTLEDFVLTQAMERPLVVHFDDFQLASETLRQFVVSLLSASYLSDGRRTGKLRLFLVVSERPQGATSTRSMQGLTELDVAPFSTPASEAFWRTLFATEDIPQSVLDGVCRAAGGSPGLLLELAKEVVARGIVRHNGARWVFPDSVAEIPLPTSWRGMIQERLSALAQPLRDLLEWLAISPHAITAPVLARCTRASISDVLPQLQTLCDKGLIKLEGDDKSPESHKVTLALSDLRLAASESVEPERRRFLHQRLAQVLEEESGSGGAEDERLAEALAHHWLAAGNEPGFLRYAPKAAAALRRGGNSQEAIALERRVAEAMPPDAAARKIQSLVRLSEMQELAWDLNASQQSIESVLDLGKQILKPRDRALLYRRLANLAVAGNDTAKALAAVTAARQSLVSARDAILTAALDALEAWALWLQGEQQRSELMLAKAEQALLTAPSGDAKEAAAAAGALNLIAGLHHQLGWLERAKAAHERQLALLERLPGEQARAATHTAYGALLLDLGAGPQARHSLEAAEKAAKLLGDQRTLCRARERLGDLHLRYGDAKQALLITQAALADAASLANPIAKANALRTLGRIYWRAGQEQDAEQAVKEAMAIHVAQRDVVQLPLTRVLLGRIHLDQGQPEIAIAQAQAAKAEAKARGLVQAEGLATHLEWEICLATQQRIDPTQVEALAVRLHGRGYAHETCELHLFAARLGIASGQVPQASAALERAASLVESVGSHEQKARAALLAALLEAERGEIQSALGKIATAEVLARNAVLPRLLRQCKEAKRGLAVEA